MDNIELSCPHCHRLIVVNMKLLDNELDDPEVQDMRDRIRQAAGVIDEYGFGGTVKCFNCSQTIYVSLHASAVTDEADENYDKA